MKRKILILIVLCLIDIVVYAEKSEEKLDKISMFSRNFIDKGMSVEHIDNSGMPILNYKRGQARVHGYNEILFHTDYDYHEKIVINRKKWNFDCSSFISYIFKKTINLNLLTNNYLGGNPYMVTDFLNDTVNFDDVTARSGIDLNGLINIKDILRKGDLIIVKDKHIAMYIGNDEIVESSQTLIGMYNDKYTGYRKDGLYNLGFGISSFNSFIQNKQDEKFVVIRLKDSIIENSDVNTIITWPDTNKEENLVSEKKVNDTEIILDYDVKDYTNSLSLNVKIIDLDGLNGYKIEKDNKKSDYIKLLNINEYAFNYNIEENGIYKIYVKDILNNEKVKEVEIKNIDKTPPIINKLYSENGYIIINGEDTESGLSNDAYSFDDCTTWNNSNKLEVKEGEYTVCIKDKLGNINKDKIIVKNENKEDNKKNNNNKSLYLLLLLPLIFLAFTFYYKKMEKGDIDV